MELEHIESSKNVHKEPRHVYNIALMSIYKMSA
jgi:hypothetical protein